MSSPARTTILQLVKFAILAWKLLLLSTTTIPSGTCVKESDPLFSAMPLRNRPSFLGALCEVALIVAIDSGHMSNLNFATVFHWMQRLPCCSVKEMFGFLGMLMLWFQRASKDSTGMGPVKPGMRCEESPTSSSVFLWGVLCVAAMPAGCLHL